MSILSRRKMFSAMTGIGVSTFVADHAIAVAFDDQDYLRERTERLTAHQAHVNKEDADWNAIKEQYAKDDAIVETYVDAGRLAHAYGTPCVHTVPLEHYKLLCTKNLIDFIPDSEGKMMIPVLMGHLVKALPV